MQPPPVPARLNPFSARVGPSYTGLHRCEAPAVSSGQSGYSRQAGEIPADVLADPSPHLLVNASRRLGTQNSETENQALH